MFKYRVRHPSENGGAECIGNASQTRDCTFHTTSTATTNIVLGLVNQTANITAGDLSSDIPAWSPVGSIQVNATIARQLAESASTVSVNESLTVSNPYSFQADLSAAEAIRDSIAINLGLRTDEIIIRSVAVRQQSQTGNQTSSLLESGYELGARDTPQEGIVDAVVDVACESVSTEACFNTTTNLSPAEVNNEMVRQLRNRNVEYTVTVAGFDVKEVDTKTRATLKEAAIRSSANTFCVPYLLQSVVLIVLLAYCFGSNA